MNEYYDEDELEEHDEQIEAFCVRCRETVVMEEPMPVWTRRGIPATRGDCPFCGGLVFRMGKTAMHNEAERPAAVQIGDSDKRKRPKLSRDTVYVNYAAVDEELAQQISADLEKAGIPVWLHEHHRETNPIKWAGGVHPALKECARMVYILSPSGLLDAKITAAWKFFRERGKPIVIAQVGSADPPDAIRRSPRFDLTGDYKTAFRQMIQALSQ